MFNKKQFAKLLKKSIGDRTTTIYAEITGVNRTYISKLINEKLENPPSPDIIKRLTSASYGDVTYENLMAAAGYLTHNEGDVWDEIKKQIIGKDRDSYIDKVAEKMARELQIDPSETKDKIIYALDNFDKLSIESQIELISSLVPYHEYDDQGNALVVRAFPPNANGIKEPSSQYDTTHTRTISLKDEVDREVEAFHEKGINIDRGSARKIVEHRRLILQGKEKCIEYIYEAKTLANALERLAELDFEFNFDDETMGRLVRRAREKYGMPEAKHADPAAHGPNYPGSGIFDKNGDREDEA